MRDERGFTLMESLTALFVTATLLLFVIPLYLTGKSFTQERMLENKAKLLAQAAVEERLSNLQLEKASWTDEPYHYQTEVTRDNSLWHVQVTIQWRGMREELQHITLETYRYQNVASPS